MINCWIGVGRIAKDPVYRVSAPSGNGCSSFSLVVEKDIKKDGFPTADFINCVAWNKVADVINNYTKKGSMIGIKGRIQTRSFDGSDGKKVYVTEILVENIQLIKTEHTEVQSETQNEAPKQKTGIDISSDDLPF